MKINDDGVVVQDEKQTKKEKKKEIDWATNPGNPIQPVYKSVYVEEEKCYRVKKIKDINVYEIIQASRSASDLAILRQRFIELGEVPAYSRDLGSVDYTLYPENIHDLYRIQEKAEIGFNSLPEDLRNDLGSVNAFITKSLDGTFSKYTHDFYAKKAASITAAGGVKDE